MISGNYRGEQASVSAGAAAGGNWLYGSSNNNQIRAAGDPAPVVGRRRLQKK